MYRIKYDDETVTWLESPATKKEVATGAVALTAVVALAVFVAWVGYRLDEREIKRRVAAETALKNQKK